MPDLPEGGFDLDGYQFGALPNLVETFDPGTAEWRVQDSDSPTADTRQFGRDLLSGPSWTFELSLHDEPGEGGLLAALSRAWRPEDVRSTPGAYSTLRYCLNGRTRRVYGRPRRFTPQPDNRFEDGLLPVTCDFATLTPYTYADAERESQVSLVPAQGGGFTFPAAMPLYTEATGTRDGIVNDTGTEAPAPVVVTFTANGSPLTNPWVSGPGWRLALNATLPYDGSVTIDARPWVATVLDHRGASLAGDLSRTSRLSEARLQPGPAALSFGGISPTGAASCSVRWRPTYYSL